MYDIPFDRSFLQLSNGIRHVMPSTDTKPELTAKLSMAQPVSQPAVYASGLKNKSLSDSQRKLSWGITLHTTNFLSSDVHYAERYIIYCKAIQSSKK
jgi:hypothetical protein